MAAGFIIAACGGGGAGTSTGQFQGGPVQIEPAGATFYAGVPNTIVISGGRRPYILSSSEPSLIPVPQTLDGSSFQVVPPNPGVIDAGLQPGDLPVRSVNITARDANGTIATATIKVGQNFLTGYGVAFSSNCASASAGTAPAACAGGETLLFLRSVTNGNIFGGRAVRFEALRGPFQFVFPETGQLGNTITTTTDHSGAAQVIFRVPNGIRGQLAVVRVTDVATGVYVDEVFPIVGQASTTLTALPDAFTFTGPDKATCGTGSGTFLVFDGQPPYTAVSSDPNVRVSPTSTNSNPGVFTITAFNPSVCVTGATIVITDVFGGRTTVKVDTVVGSATPPAPLPLAVAPTSITLACGTSGSVSAVGGSGGFVVNSTHPRVTAVAAGNTITITRLAGDAPGSSFPTTGAVSVTDGTTIATITLTVPATCP